MPRIIIIRSKGQLLSISFIYALAKRMKEMNYSRLGGIEWLAATLFRDDIEIRTPEGDLIEIDDELGYGDDGSWNSEMKKRADCPPRRRPRATLYRRLALWCAAFILIGAPIEIDDAD